MYTNSKNIERESRLSAEWDAESVKAELFIIYYQEQEINYKKFHRPLVLKGRGLLRGTKIAEKDMISGESGDTDSPEVPVASGQNLNSCGRVLFVCRYLPTDKNFFLCVLCVFAVRILFWARVLFSDSLYGAIQKIG
jgi:hypothetical protein